MDVLSDESMMRIIFLSSAEPISLVDLSTACGITGAACYRRISDLKKMELLEEVEEPEASAVDDHLYRSTVKRIELNFREGHIYSSIERLEGDVRRGCIDPLSGMSLPWKEARGNFHDEFGAFSPITSL